MKNELSMIKVVTFDLWNTLFINKFYDNSRFYFFLQYLNEKQIDFSFDKLNNAYNTFFHLSNINFEEINYRHIYTNERIIRLLKNLNITLTNTEIIEITTEFEETMLSDPPLLKTGVKDTLLDLSNDYKIGLISNTGITPGRVIKNVLQEYDILDYFKLLLFSDEIGFYKPAPIMFRKVLKEFNCTPQNVIHVGDRLETDIKGANECNMLTIWMNDSNLPKSEEIQPGYEIQKIPEIVKIIKGIP